MLSADVPKAYLAGLRVADADLRGYLRYRFEQYVRAPDEAPTMQKVDAFVETLCDAIFVGTPAAAPTGQLKFTVAIKGTLRKDPIFPLALPDALGKNGSAVQQGLQAVLAGPAAQRDRCRSWVRLHVAYYRDLGRPLKLSRYEVDHTATEVRFYSL
jgi:hypothetical protein